MQYIIKTTYPCILKTQNEFVELDETSSVACEDESIVYVYPQKCGVPFCLNLTERADTDKYSFYKHNGQNFVLLESQPQASITRKENISIGGKNCKILISDKIISFESANRIVVHAIEYHYQSYKILRAQNYACVQFDNDFYAYDIQKEKLYHFSGEELSFEKDTLTITKKYNDNSCRERKYKVSFADDITIIENTFMRKEQKEEDLIPLDFLQAIKAEDFSCALNFLNDKLKEKIGRIELESFFGKIQQILPININEFIVFAKNKKFYMSFDIKNKQICDISLDEL